MATEEAEAIPKKAKCPKLDFAKQNFLLEAKFVIAKHHEKINENKVQGTSINVFKNKHQNPKLGRFIPFEVDEKEARDMIKKHQKVLKCINYPKETPTSECLKEPSKQQPSVKEPRTLNIKEKYQPIDDVFTNENIKLSQIVTDIESVSKKIENIKQQLGKPRALLDWRGIVSTKSFHFPCTYSRSFSASSTILRDLVKTFKKKKPKPIEPEPKPEQRPKVVKMDKLDSKVKRIGPHIEIFQVFKGRNRLIITKRVIKLITVIQAYVRGWLERKRMQRILTKALYHGPNLKAVINMYRILIHRIRHRLDLWRIRQIINFLELEEWMDRKKFYETMFAKREDWQGLERSELLKYFNDCGHFPTQSQVDDCWNLFHKGGDGRYSDIIKRCTAIEMLFTLYPPQGAKVRNNMTLRSTWLRPIVNGEEGYKYIVSGHPILKRANIRIVGRLVASSIRERKMRQFYKS